MVVPNYVPDPVEIPDNVTEKPYKVRLAFVRRVTLWHLLSASLVAAAAWMSMGVSVLWPSIALGLALTTLSLIRIGLRGSTHEWVLSAALLPILLLSLGLTLGALGRQGVPVWAPGVGLLCAAVYGLVCGRDFSFVGQWVLALTGSSLIIIVLDRLVSSSPNAVQAALGLNAAYVTFYVYDLASLLSRRRLGEEAGAVADLYRDVLNFLGYFVRVVHHWRKHRILALR